MPDPVTWYTLPKTVDDLTSIDDEINAFILAHNIDVSAHGQSGEGLWTHRIADVLDHVNYSIYNIKLAPRTRTVKAFVGPVGVGDFSDIQEAIEYVNLHGGGQVFVLAGTYNLVDDIKIYDKIELVGEGPGKTILNFTVDSKRVVAMGTLRFPYADSWSIPQDSKILTGVNSDFLSTVSAGDYVSLLYVIYKIASVDSDTQLTLESNYRGPALNELGAPAVADYVENWRVADLQIQGCTGWHYMYNSGLVTSEAAFFEVSNVLSRGNQGYGFYFYNAVEGMVRGCRGVDSDWGGFGASGFWVSAFLSCSAYGNAGYGFDIGGCGPLPPEFTDCEAYHNADHGFCLTYANYYSFSGCMAYENQGDGFRVHGSDFNRFLGCGAWNNEGWGFNISSNLSDKNIIVGLVSLNNTLGNLRDLGTATEIGHNITA